MTSSNKTYAQPTTLSVKLKDGYYPFDELRLFVPKSNFKSLLSFNEVSLSGLSQVENSTYFVIDKIYSLPDSAFALQLLNAHSTDANGKLLVEMYVQGYLSSTGLIDLPSIQPAYLHSTVSSSNRFVG